MFDGKDAFATGTPLHVKLYSFDHEEAHQGRGRGGRGGGGYVCLFFWLLWGFLVTLFVDTVVVMVRATVVAAAERPRPAMATGTAPCAAT